MINLIPPEVKTNIKYAKRNLILILWAAATAVGIVGIAGVVLAGQFYIKSATKAYATQAQLGHERLKSQKLDETQKEVQDIGGSIKLAVDVLSKSVLFSKLIQGIGSAMPAGASLQSLTITKVDGAIDLQVGAADYQTGTQVQVNLQDPANKIFDKADIIGINCQPVVAGGKYPCTVSIRARFAKDNQFLLINSGVTR